MLRNQTPPANRGCDDDGVVAVVEFPQAISAALVDGNEPVSTPSR